VTAMRRIGIAVTVFLSQSQCMRPSGDAVLDSWNTASIANTVAACKEGAAPPMTDAEATKACECVVAEMQKRWATPRDYAQDREAQQGARRGWSCGSMSRPARP
jgi:hypothetical protein